MSKWSHVFRDWLVHASKCVTCGAPTGNINTENRRIDEIKSNGTIKVDTRDFYTGKEYKQEELATYDAKQWTSKGYVDVGSSDDALRGSNVITN